MKALNRKERKKANVKFIAMFTATFALIFGCSFFVFQIAGEGVQVLEEKHKTYINAFENQALVTFKMEEIIDKIYSLKNKKVNRTINEQKNLQGLISSIRLDLEKLMGDEETNLKEFALYRHLLEEVSTIQTAIDLFKEDEESRRNSQELLERCRQKYKEDRIKEGRGEKEDEA